MKAAQKSKASIETEAGQTEICPDCGTGADLVIAARIV